LRDLGEVRILARDAREDATRNDPPSSKSLARCNLCQAWMREQGVMTETEKLDFDRWAESAAPRLRRLGFLVTGDWHLAEDLTQDTLIRIYSVWGRVSRAGAPNSYASRVLVNLSTSWRRVARNRERPTGHLPDRAGPVSDSAGADLQGRLAAALAHLGTSQRTIVVLRHWEGRSEAEVAQMLGLSLGTVKSQGSRGLAHLRRLLELDDAPVGSKGAST
jgi:RNA polymerase sigma-70 factor (sigma-E family)